MQALGRLRRRRLGLAALFVVFGFVVVAVLASSLAPYGAGRVFLQFLNQPQAPSLHGGHLLGTDVIGHDELSQLLYALRRTIFEALLAAGGATLVGVVVGSVAGFYGGVLDAALGWLTGVVVTVPALAVLLLLVVYYSPLPLWLVGLALAGYLWTGVSRVLRASVASLRVREFVEAAYAAGASDLRVIVRHLLPNSAGLLLVAATSALGQSILIIATADYFQLGAEQPDRPTLGGLIASATLGSGTASGVATPAYLYIVPTVVLGLLLVSVNFAADTLDEALNPAGQR